MDKSIVKIIEKKSIPNFLELIKLLKENRVSVFVGAGISKDAGYPLWQEFIEKYLNEQGEIDDLPKDLPEAVQILIDKYGEEFFKEKVIQAFGPEGKSHFDSKHKYIMKSQFQNIITTNYDMCLNNAAMDDHKNPLIHDIFFNLKPSDLNKREIFHIHGCINPEENDNNINTIVMSREQYTEAYEKTDVLNDFLKALFRESIVVFTGVSLQEPPINKIIRIIKSEEKIIRELEQSREIQRKVYNSQYILIHQNELKCLNPSDEDKLIRVSKLNTLLEELHLKRIVFLGDKNDYHNLDEILRLLEFMTSKLTFSPNIDRRDYQ